MNKLKTNNTPFAPEIDIRGACSPDGTRWVQVYLDGKCSRWLPYDSFRKTGAIAEATLAEQGLVFMKPDFQALMVIVRQLSKFPARVIASRIGWTGNVFALPSTKLISPKKSKDCAAAFTPIKGRDDRQGSTKEWRNHVANLLSGQHLASFFMMIPFAAPLLRITGHPTNFGFEIAGRGGIGKSTICKLAVSAMGPMERMTVSMNATPNAIDQLMVQFNDQVLMLEEWNILALQGGASAGQQAARLAFTMGDGNSKRRFDQRAGKRVRFLWLTSTNRGLPSMLEGIDPQTANAALDRTLTLAIPDQRKYGIFDGPTEGFDSVSAMVEELTHAAGMFYGSAFRKYLKLLVSMYDNDKDDFRLSLLLKQQHFVQKMSGLGLIQTHQRVVEAFGLVYTAGRLARHFNVLPKNFDCMEATKTAYLLHVNSRASIKTPIQKLHELLASDKLLEYSETGKITDKQIAKASGILYNGFSNGKELLLTRQQLSALTLNPSAFLKNTTVRSCMVREDGRLQVYRYVSADDKRKRFFCFLIGALEDQGYW